VRQPQVTDQRTQNHRVGPPAEASARRAGRHSHRPCALLKRQKPRYVRGWWRYGLLAPPCTRSPVAVHLARAAPDGFEFSWPRRPQPGPDLTWAKLMRTGSAQRAAGGFLRRTHDACLDHPYRSSDVTRIGRGSVAERRPVLNPAAE
jgi:hypothetical protein